MGLDLRLPPNPPCHTAIDSLNGLHFPSEKATTPSRATPCAENATPFHTPSVKGVFCAPAEKGSIFCAPSEKGGIFFNSSEKGSIFCDSSEKGSIFCNSSEKGAPFHITCEKGLLPFHAASDNGTTIFCAASEKKGTPLHINVSKKGTPFHGATASEIAFCAAADKGTPLYSACEKGILHAASEKANPFPVISSKTISFPSDKMAPFLPASAKPPVPLQSVSDKMTFLHSSANKLAGVIAPFPSLPHPLALFQQLRRHHGLVTSDRLAHPDVILPKSSPLLPMTSPSLPAPPGTVLQNLLSSCSTHRGGHGEHASMTAAAATIGPVAVSGFPLSALWMSESGHHHLHHSAPGTSPYGRKVFPCPQCRYTTDRRNNLKRHMVTMHQLSAKLLECCGLLFRTKAALREHALVFHYHGYSCFYCGRRFCRKALLKRHLSVHSGQKEFLCGVCDYATSHKSNLERHRRVHVRQDVVDDDGVVSGRGGDDDVTSGRGGGGGGRGGGAGQSQHGRHRDRGDVASVCDDVKSDVSESHSHHHVDCVSLDELSVLSSDDEEEIDVHGD